MSEPDRCASCQSAFTEHWYQVNDKAVCPQCAESIRTSVSPVGGRAGRVAKALVLGSLAALAGAAAHYAVLRMFNINAALVTIFMGFLVGAAVRRGSGNRGGWRYQTLAVLLTYCAISTAYVPLAWEELRKEGETSASETQVSTGESGQPALAVNKANSRPSPAKHAKPASKPAPTGAEVLASLPILLGIAVLGFFALPIGVGISSPMSLLIFGFGLFRAWKMNERVEIAISGPLTVGSPAVS